MSNINLSTENVTRKKNDPIGRSLIFSISILVVLLALYGVLIVADRGITSKTKLIKEKYDVEYDKFLAGNSNDILDFKNRSDLAGKIMTQNLVMPDVLAHIEGSILPAVYLNSLDYDKEQKKVSLLCVGDSFQTVAEQILSFKQDEYFSSVSLKDSHFDLENLSIVIFNIDLIIK